MTDEGNLVRRASELDRIQASTGVPVNTLRDVVAAFEREGFLVVTPSAEGGRSPLVDISHEAIARQWRRLGLKDPLNAGWIVKEARQRAALLQVERAAKEWTDNAQGNDFLFKGLRLENAVRHIDGREAQLTEAGRRFLAVSQTRDARLRWMTPKVLAPATTALALIIGLAIFSASQRQQQALEASRAAEAETQLRLEQLERTGSGASATGAVATGAVATIPASPPPAPTQKTPVTATPPGNCHRDRRTRRRRFRHRRLRPRRRKLESRRASTSRSATNRSVARPPRVAEALRQGEVRRPRASWSSSVGPTVNGAPLPAGRRGGRGQARRAGARRREGSSDPAFCTACRGRSRARPFHYELWLAPSYRAR